MKITVVLPDTLYQEVQAQASQEMRSVANEIRMLLRRGLDLQTFMETEDRLRDLKAKSEV